MEGARAVREAPVQTVVSTGNMARGVVSPTACRVVAGALEIFSPHQFLALQLKFCLSAYFGRLGVEHRTHTAAAVRTAGHHPPFIIAQTIRARKLVPAGSVCTNGKSRSIDYLQEPESVCAAAGMMRLSSASVAALKS